MKYLIGLNRKISVWIIILTIVLEADCDYLDELHGSHNDYPLAGEKIKLTEEMLFKHQLKIIEDSNFSLGKNKTFVPNLGNKRKFKLHYKNLNFCLSLVIYRILEFKEEPFLKLHIERNTYLQGEPEKEGNKIKKQNAKLRNNVKFGKLIKNPINKFDVKIVSTRKQYSKWSSRPKKSIS